MITCQKCGAVAPDSTKGWLIHPVKNDPKRMVVRCPDHITQAALYKAGLNQQLVKPQPDRVTISRHSKLGWNYETQPTGNGIEIEEPTKPYHCGTYLTIMDAIMHDQYFKSIRSGGAYYTSCWFVKVNGMWRKISGNATDLAYQKEVEVDLVPLE